MPAKRYNRCWAWFLVVTDELPASGDDMKIEYPVVEFKHGTRSTLSNVPHTLNPRLVLEELFNLLEDYSPAWYTEDHRRRALAAMGLSESYVPEQFGPVSIQNYKLPSRKG